MILIIDNYDSFTYNLYQAVASFYSNIVVIRNDKVSIQQIQELKPSGIILSPGPKRPEDAGICIDLVKALITRDLPQIPLLGVCLGHQSIAAALGGKVVGADRICHGKDDMIWHNNSGIYTSLPQPFKAARYHSLSVDRESLPTSLIIEAHNKQNVIMGMRHNVLPIFGVQFHPESILTPRGDILIENFLDLCV